MIKSAAIELLKTFSKDEMKEFSVFINSPFHNTNKSIVKSFDVLKKYYPGFDNKFLSKEILYRKVFPGKQYNEQTVKSILFNLTKLSEEFLTYKRFLNNPILRQFELVGEILDRNKFELADKYFKDYEKMLNDSNGITEEFFKDKMDFESLKVQMNFRKDSPQATLENIYNQADYHIRFSLMRLSNFIHDLKTNEIVFNAVYKHGFIEEFISNLNLEETLSHLEKNFTQSYNEVTAIYVLRILFYLNPKEEKYFYQMKELFIKNINVFHHHEIYNHFQILEGVCWVLQKEVNREKFERELYELYILRLEKGVYSPDQKYMRVILYRAIFVITMKYKDFKYIENYIDTYIEKLLPEHRVNMRNYSNALLYFEKREFEKSLGYSIKINFELFAFRYDIRQLMFKVYYELGYFEEALSLIDTHRHFISNNKTVSERYKELHTNFLKYYSILLKIKMGNTGLEPELIRRKISDENNLVEKEWLLSKADEFLKDK